MVSKASLWPRKAPKTSRRFPAPWSVEQIPGGYKVLDAPGKPLPMSMPAQRDAREG